MKVPPELVAYLKEKNNFVIATHVNPEGDALGSSIALSLALRQIGKEAVVFNKDAVPSLYRFLPQHTVVKDTISSHVKDLILLDCNSLQRAGLEKCAVDFSAVIDHHRTRSSFGDIQWILPKAPATGLMIYFLIKELGADITEDIAANLYTAIGIDTGIFRYSNTTAECILVASELVREGADAGFIADRLYNNYSKGRFLLLREALNNVEIYDAVCVTVITREMYRKTHTGAEDTENFVNFPLFMDDIRISVLFRQLDTESWKVSLRSKGDIDVSAIASQFDGGGHKNAAGYAIDTGLEEAKEMLLKRIRDGVL